MVKNSLPVFALICAICIGSKKQSFFAWNTALWQKIARQHLQSIGFGLVQNQIQLWKTVGYHLYNNQRVSNGNFQVETFKMRRVFKVDKLRRVFKLDPFFETFPAMHFLLKIQFSKRAPQFIKSQGKSVRNQRIRLNGCQDNKSRLTWLIAAIWIVANLEAAFFKLNLALLSFGLKLWIRNFLI